MRNWTKGKPYTVKHFAMMNVPRNTAYLVIWRCYLVRTLTRISRCGRPAVIMPKIRPVLSTIICGRKLGGRRYLRQPNLISPSSMCQRYLHVRHHCRVQFNMLTGGQMPPQSAEIICLLSTPPPLPPLNKICLAALTFFTVISSPMITFFFKCPRSKVSLK